MPEGEGPPTARANADGSRSANWCGFLPAVLDTPLPAVAVLGPVGVSCEHQFGHDNTDHVSVLLKLSRDALRTVRSTLVVSEPLPD